jgi:hypothetical protein
MITDSMKDGVVQYGDTFLEGKLYNQRSLEHRLTKAIQVYSETESQDFMKGLLTATQIIKGLKNV